MKERVLFHLRLPCRPQVERAGSGKSLPVTPDEGPSAQATMQGASLTTNAGGLVPTCLHSGSSSNVAVGFENGVVHVYHRLPPEDVHHVKCEEGRWKRSVLYPTKRLGNGRNSPNTAPEPDITCVALSPAGDLLAAGTSTGIVCITQAPPAAAAAAAAKESPGRNSVSDGAGAGGAFHHKSHRGERVNCLLWDPSGDRLFSVCSGGVVILAKNLRPRRPAPSAADATGVTGMMNFLGIQKASLSSSMSSVRATPLAVMVAQLASPGVHLDLGRTVTSLAAVTGRFGPRSCDVLLVVTREKAVLLYFAVGADVSIVAPHETAVDLNVLQVGSNGEHTKEDTEGSPLLPPPPSRTDLGACLWGPPPASLPRGAASSPQSAEDPLDSGEYGAPRFVSFAYVAQPGGRLWRVALADAEVESMHRPTVDTTAAADAGSNGNAGATDGPAELGHLRAIDVGGSQTVLCWKTTVGPSSQAAGEFALLDTVTHRFVATCPGLPGIVDISGSLLSIGSASTTAGGDDELEPTRALRDTVRILHGGDNANVSQLLTEEASVSIGGSKDVVDDTLANSADDDRAAAVDVHDIATRAIQRAWRTRKHMRDQKRLAAWKDSIRQPYVPGGKSSLSRPAPSVRDIASGDLSGADTESPMNGSTRKRQRSMDLEEEASSPRKSFSVLESLDALDAAERVLQMSSNSAEEHGGKRNKRAWLQESASPARDRSGVSKAGLGSEGEEAKDLVRATDALIRETWPVLRRTRSWDQYRSPLGSPRRGKVVPASVPSGWNDVRGRGSQIAAALAAAEGFTGDVEREGRGERADGSRARPSASRWEEREQEQEQEPGQGAHRIYPPSGSASPSWRDSGREAYLGNRSRSGSESEGRRFEPPAPSAIPFPGSHAARHAGGSSSRGSDRAASYVADAQRRKSAPQPSHGNLFGPVQNMMGTLLQRSVQAVNDALQPGGGAMSDDSSSDDNKRNDALGQRRTVAGALYDNSDLDHDFGADGGTTSDTGKDSWDASSERSEGEGRNVSAPAIAKTFAGGHLDGIYPGSPSPKVTGQHKKHALRRQSAERRMLFASGMMGVRRRNLSKLRSTREEKLKANIATVMDLPASAIDDPSPFVPPSQYEVRLNVSRGLGLSLQITGSDVRVKGFSPVKGGDVGPAEACGEIQAGDALIRVNHEQLTLLGHDSVVTVLRSLLNASGEQTVLLRFAYAEGGPPRLPPPTSVRIETRPASLRPSASDGNARSPDRSSPENEDPAFRPESWHGSRKRGGLAGERREARSVSPARADGAGLSRRHSHSLGDEIEEEEELARPTSGMIKAPVEMSVGFVGAVGRKEAGEVHAEQSLGASLSRGQISDWARFGTRGLGGRGERMGALWGESETRIKEGGGRAYLGDMGHARAQRTLGHIARDVQGLHLMIHSAEESRFFRGRSKPSLTDTSEASVDMRTPPPSTLLASLPSPLSTAGTRALSLFEARPPIPREVYPGRRRRRSRRMRTLLRPHATTVAEVGDGPARDEGVIDLESCRSVVEGELRRLEVDVERHASILAKRGRWSSIRGIVAKVLRHHDHARGRARPLSSPNLRRRRRHRFAWSSPTGASGGAGATWRGSSSSQRLSARRSWHGVEVESDHSEEASSISDDALGASTPPEERAVGAGAYVDSANGGMLSGEAAGVGDGHVPDKDGSDEEGSFDLFVEAVSTGGMQEELLSTLAVEALGADPPRPLPYAVYDLQTALEAVQHFGTQTLAGVVQAEATQGLESDSARSPRTRDQRAAAAAKAREAREGDAAAGLGEDWESAWPPRELTASLALVTARQMAHAMRCDSEPLIQVWMRCFSPLGVQHRDKLWGSLAPSPLDSGPVYAGRWHRQLVCGLVTLFAQVHVSWPFLRRPLDEAAAVGLLSLRLKMCWFSSAGDIDDAENGPGADGASRGRNAAEEGESTMGCRQGPGQWDEDKVVEFIQEYGCYLDIDALAAAVSCREMEWALSETLSLAERCADYRANERTLRQLLRGPRTPLSRSPVLSPVLRSPVSTPGTRTPTVGSPRSPMLAPRTLSLAASPVAIDAALRAQAPASSPMEEEAVRKTLGLPPPRRNRHHPGGFSEGGDKAFGSGGSGGGGGNGAADRNPGGAPLCLLLNNLGELFRWDAAAAADVCADAFPGVRPWNVHLALHQQQGKAWSSAEPGTPSHPPGAGHGSSRYPAGDDASLRHDAAFQSYLWAMMEKNPECRRDWKTVQRCLQLSLRLATRLRALPSEHHLHAYCDAATRNINCRQHRASFDRRPGRGWPASFPQGNTSPVPGMGAQQGHGGDGGYARPATVHLSRGSSAALPDVPAWQKYADAVAEVVTSWCADKDSFDLDPFWLMPKLRVHKKWRAVLEVCAAVSRSWEEYGARRERLLETQTYTSVSTPPLQETIQVFDALAEACFSTFEDGLKADLAAALGAAAAADSALRSTSERARHSSRVRDPSQNVSSGVVDGELDGHNAPQGVGAQDEEDNVTSPGWVQDSRLMDIIQGLVFRCREVPEANDIGNGAGGDGFPIGHVDQSLTMTATELAKAVLDGVGPSTTLEIVEACPRLLEQLPPSFFQALADREACLLQEQALEAKLLQQATAAVWTAQSSGDRNEAVGPARNAGGGQSVDRHHRGGLLGPRLAWLAFEEMWSFFQQKQHDDALDPSLPTPTFASNPRSLPSVTGGALRDEQDHVARAVRRTGVNLILPNNAHHGVHLRPQWPCGLCGLPLYSPNADAGLTGGNHTFGNELDVIIRTCGHGHHVVCLEEASMGSSWCQELDAVAGLNRPCAACDGGR